MADKKTLTVADLKPADVLLSTATGAVSSVIRFGTSSRYSHSALYVGNGRVIEAIERGVVDRHLDEALQASVVVELYRPMGIKPAQAQAVIVYAKTQEKKPYDYKGVAATSHNGSKGKVLCWASGAACQLLDGMNRQDSEVAFYCSELIAHAFFKAGYPLAATPYSSTPQSIAESKGLAFVGILKDRPEEQPKKPAPSPSPKPSAGAPAR